MLKSSSQSSHFFLPENFTSGKYLCKANNCMLLNDDKHDTDLRHLEKIYTTLDHSLFKTLFVILIFWNAILLV